MRSTHKPPKEWGSKARKEEAKTKRAADRGADINEALDEERERKYEELMESAELDVDDQRRHDEDDSLDPLTGEICWKHGVECCPDCWSN